MPRTRHNDNFKTFAGSVWNIRRLGERLAVVQADVVAIKSLSVDEQGDADAVITVGKSVSLLTGLRLRPAVMLEAKHSEICRTTESLKSEFDEIIGHAMELVARCEQTPPAPKTTPHLTGAFGRMESEVNELIAKSGQARAQLSQVAERPSPPLRPRLAARQGAHKV
jgi:hypothetical protein